MWQHESKHPSSKTVHIWRGKDDLRVPLQCHQYQSTLFSAAYYKLYLHWTGKQNGYVFKPRLVNPQKHEICLWSSFDRIGVIRRIYQENTDCVEAIGRRRTLNAHRGSFKTKNGEGTNMHLITCRKHDIRERNSHKNNGYGRYEAGD